jgi:hypothetical protein
MERAQAKEILARWRPGAHLDSETDVQQARRFAQSDPETAQWLERHRQFQDATSQALRHLPVPSDLATLILDNQRILRPAFRWNLPLRVAVAAALVAAAFWLWSLFQLAPGTDYTTFRSRMVRAAIREYRMEITTPDLPAIRSYLARNQAPADFEFPSGLASLPPIGAGTLSWRGGRTTMVCLDGGPDGMLYVFVVPETGLSSVPPAEAEFARVNRLSTGTWSHNGKTYVVASSASLEAIQKYF